METRIKRCCHCRENKSLNNFYHFPKHGISNLDRDFRGWCNDCWKEKELLKHNKKIRCRGCWEIKDRTYYGHFCSSCYNKERYKENKDYILAENKKYRNSEKGKKKMIFLRAMDRAKKNNLPFNLTEDDIIIPQFCPVLGIEIKLDNPYGLHESSPSIDRIIPEKGYVKGNIAIISMKANTMKNNGTLEEHIKLVEWMKRVTNAT